MAGEAAAGEPAAAPSFYARLAPAMAELFPLGADLARLADTLLGPEPAHGLLDLGAGTGALAMHVAARGVPVVAIDSEPEAVDWARRRAAERGLRTVRFVAGDLLAAPRELAERFALVTCVGNTLPHLAERAEVEAALAGMREVLAPGGHVVVQTINADRCLALGGLDLPEREAMVGGERFVLRRRYRPGPEPGRLRFSTEIEAGGEVRRFELTHLALGARELEALARAAGFAEVRLLGSYGGAPWSEAAPATVVVAAR